MDFSPITSFEAFLKKEIIPATSDIEKLEDKNRKHIQKLVFTNLVDRFDTMVDQCILANCREPAFAEAALKNATGSVTEAELVTLLLHSENLQDALTMRLQDGLRNSVLRNRHSHKLQQLVKVMAPNSGADVPSPRVNISTGNIVESFKVQDKAVPHSVVGYADWLYSRRNSVVHGAGTNRYLENDRKQIKKTWKVELRQTFRILVGSIKTATSFYDDLTTILQSEA